MYNDYVKSREYYRMELIKENNEWKISKVTLLSLCGGPFDVE